MANVGIAESQITSNKPASGGSGENSGSATLNFGAAPGTSTTSVVVTGQSGILSTSFIELFFMGNDSTATHNTTEHKMAPLGISLSADTIVPGTGFTINAETTLRLTGTFIVRWAWS